MHLPDILLRHKLRRGLRFYRTISIVASAVTTRRAARKLPNLKGTAAMRPAEPAVRHAPQLCDGALGSELAGASQGSIGAVTALYVRRLELGRYS
jgi:hypothetical protein